jgi:hypothetical protein
MAVATVVIIAGVVVAAVGRGGEMGYFTSDYAPLDLGVVAATDVVLLRPPTSIWGYNIQVTDEALGRITQSLNQRDVRIASLEQQVADLRADLRAERDRGAERGLGAAWGLGAEGGSRAAGQDRPGTAADPRAAGWEARATGWEARATGWEARAAGWETAAAGPEPGTAEVTGQGPVPASRPRPAVDAGGVPIHGAPERLRAQAADAENGSGQEGGGEAEPGTGENGAVTDRGPGD